MPSFGVPCSVPSGSSLLSPGISTLMSSDLSSGPETSSCAAIPEGYLSHLFGLPHLPPPPPLSLSEFSPYALPPAYSPMFPPGPPLLASARFPPPPNPSFARPASNITFFEGPQSHYPPDNTAYDRWSDRSISSIPYGGGGGGDHVSKNFAHWPLPTYNSSITMNSKNNSNAGFLKPEPIFQPFASYPPVDSVTNFGPKFSPFSGFTNAAAAGMPSTPSASITSPLASGHFTAFPPPNLPPDFPHFTGGGGRFPFNAHGPTFLPDMDPPPTFGPGSAEYVPEPFPSYMSRPGAAYRPSFQSPDHFHDDPSRTIPFPGETTPHPIVSDSNPPLDSAFSSRIYYPPPEPFHGSPNAFSHTFSSRGDRNATGQLCSTEGAPGLELSSDFLASFTLPYPPPHRGSEFTPCSSSSAPPLCQDSSSRNSGGFSSSLNKRDEERRNWIVGETGKLLYQHLSPEELRWKHYEPSFADGLDPSGIFARVRPAGFNHFNGLDSTMYSTVPSSSNDFVVKEERPPSGALKNLEEQFDMLERSKVQNQSGPSLKLAASALAEMLASGSNGASNSTGQSLLSKIEGTPGNASTSKGGFQLVNANNGGQARPERMLEDCCSSSGSAVILKEGSSSLIHGFGDTSTGYGSGLNLGSPTRCKREISHVPEDAFCVGGASGGWDLPKASGQMENSAHPRPINWVDAGPQSVKGGPIHSIGLQSSKGTAGILRQPSVSTGSAKLHGVVAEKGTPEIFKSWFTQSSNESSGLESGKTERVSSQPVGLQLSNDPTSVISPTTSKETPARLSWYSPHQEVSSVTSSQLPLDPSHNDQWQVKSTSCGSSPPLSQAHLDHQRSVSGTSMGAASRVLANRKWSCPDSASQTEVAYLGTGFHSLTASISNLSKVLLSLDSSALTPPDSATLEESLQSSILRLSECLLLVQARINRNPATCFVGSDESSTSRQGRADGSLGDIDFGRRAETGGSTNLIHLKASGFGVAPNAGRSGSPSQLCNSNDLRATSTNLALETVDSGGPVINSVSLQGPFPLNSESYNVSQCSTNDIGFMAGKASCRSYYTSSKPSSSSEKKGAVDDDIIQPLRDNDTLESSSLKRLIDAEEREAKLKVLVDELREELELERVENRGTVILCEKIMKEAEVSRGKVGIQEQKVDLKSEKRKSECNAQGGSTTLDNSTLDERVKAEASNGELDLTSHEKVRQIELEEATEETALMKYHNKVVRNQLCEVESRLALLRARPELIANSSSEGDLGEDMDAVADRNRSQDAVLNHSCERESLRTLLPRPAAAAPRKNDASGSVEPGFALLQAQKTSLNEHSSHEANCDVEMVMPYPEEKQSTRHDTTLDEVEERLALLHGRPDWNNELGVFTETEPCTPAIPAVIDLDSSTGSFSEHSLSAKALKTMSQMTSQLLVQSEIISNMHNAWSQLSEQVISKSTEKDCHTELKHEADVDISNAVTDEYGGTEAMEARALLIRSRPERAERDVSESKTEDFLGGQVCHMSSQNSASARYESDQFETMNEISTVRLLGEISQLFQVKNSTDCPSQQTENGDTGRVQSSKLENRNLGMKQDSEDDSSWEHVSYLQFPHNETE